MAVTIHNDVHILISASALERSNHYMKLLMDQILRIFYFENFKF